MNYIPSINIELNTASDFNYVITENAKLVAGNIANSYNSGHHSFSIIGTYGTGKSSFILAFEDDIQKGKNEIINRSVLGNKSSYEFINIVGDYKSLRVLLSKKLGCHEDDVIEALGGFYKKLKKQNRFLVIVVDEFGKILEYAANNEPEKELYFLQKLSEFINVPTRNALLLTTLHQNFGSYASRLNETQRNEWHKVKGRFKEIVFIEPVEQLLTLTAERLEDRFHIENSKADTLKKLYELGIRSRIVSSAIKYQIVEKLYPLDPISAVCLTLAIQRYGQNERSLFSFLSAEGSDSIKNYVSTATYSYNVSSIYDYLKNNFYSEINETNSDSMGWRAIYVAIDRIEGSDLKEEMINDCLKLIKTIGLINLFFNGIILDQDFLLTYGKFALGLSDSNEIISTLLSRHIIRYAKYKSQYILFEGTNIDIEDELYKAASIVPLPSLTVAEITPYINQKVTVASASYYKTGTPRYFEYRVNNEPIVLEPAGDIDGYIHLIFPLSDIEDEVKRVSESSRSGASIYGYFKNTDEIVRHLYEIKKLKYVKDNIAFDDRVAKAELENQINYELQRLNESISLSLNGYGDKVDWYFKGEYIHVQSLRDFNKLLSHVCDAIYFSTPIIKNELFNRQKLSSAISLARVNLLDAMLNKSDQKAFGIDGFPPEKTIYYTLFKESGIHHQDEFGNWVLGSPISADLNSIWVASIDFLSSAVEKPRKLSELVKTLKTEPFKLKQGVIDFWIPIFLYINQQDFALYNGTTFVLSINKEVFELIQKRISDFSVRAYQVSGVKLEFFKRYRQFLKKDDSIGVCSDSLIETVKPFFQFYRGLNNYAKNTRKFDSVYTARFRDILSEAHDPAKAFFEDIPAAFGYRDFENEEFTKQYLTLIRGAVRELNACYDNLIDRIEEKIVEHLGLPSEFETYKNVLERRFQTIDSRILPPKTRSFLDRVLTPSNSKKEFIEKISVVMTDKRLDETKDSEEPLLINKLLHVFSELERYSSIESESDGVDGSEAYNFELASNKGDYSPSKTYRIPKNKTKKADEMAFRIESMFSDDDELNICVLLKLLNEKLR